MCNAFHLDFSAVFPQYDKAGSTVSAYIVKQEVNHIKIRGLRLHNLEGLDLDIPHGGLVVVTGPSGAGKSTLAIDAIHAEAQRRYIETFSPYARQFLERLPRPDAREMSGLPAAVAIGQSNPVRNSRSTAGTLADINYPAHLLFHHLGRRFCPDCNVEVRKHTLEDVTRRLEELGAAGETRATVVAPVSGSRVDNLIALGFFRHLEGGEVRELEAGNLKGGNAGREIDLVIDRISLRRPEPERIRDSAAQAFSLGNGGFTIVTGRGERFSFYRDNRCPECGRLFPESVPGLFSFNSPSGACQECQGFGKIPDIDWDLVIPDPSLSIVEGAIRPMENRRREKQRLLEWCRKNGVDASAPWGSLDAAARKEILLGGRGWPGIRRFFEHLEKKRYKTHVRIFLARYRRFVTCGSCNGSRFRPETLEYRLNGLTIPEFYALSLEDALGWTRELSEKTNMNRACAALAADLENRLATLVAAGLGYLSAERQARTLSGGEVARINIARGLGARLANTLYVLDEPSAGLHPVDALRIRRLLVELRKRRNTVIAVEHNREMAGAADMEIALGPGSGREGGRIIFQGPPGRSPFRAGSSQGRLPGFARGRWSGREKFIRITGASANNLKDIDVKIPVGRITCITGVSGSGKSTLAEHVLFRGLCRAAGVTAGVPGKCRGLESPVRFSSVILVDQTPLSGNPRACPGSMLKVMDLVRRLFAATAGAREQGIGPGAFSFNTPAGRCPVCKGRGVEKIEMQFLPDLTLPCPECRGSRFSGRVMDIRLDGMNIAMVMKMTLAEVREAEWCTNAVAKRLDFALELGLGHLELGQPLDTLSSGEARRVKLAGHLMARELKGALLILDEPSRGLFHLESQGLAALLARISMELDATVVMVDHEPLLAMSADWIVDLGPGGGRDGGQLLFQGRARDISSCPASLTGRFLKQGASGATRNVREDAGQYMGRDKPQRPFISVKGARHHNLKDISVKIPHGKFTVITGVSGSGKSSLAFDIIFTEGQRRYMEGLSSYMKQYVKLHERPEVDSVSGLSPSVAIEQRTSRAGPMSTVATLTEIAHYVRLLYARTSTPWCPDCGIAMEAMTEDGICGRLMELMAGKEIYFLSPVVRRRKGRHEALLARRVREGVRLFRIDGELRGADSLPSLSRYAEHSIELVTGPLNLAESGRDELYAHVREALVHGDGTAGVLEQGSEIPLWFSSNLACPGCGTGVDRPDPLVFSFHNRAGQCGTCHGRGRVEDGSRCQECLGSRLNANVRKWRLGGLSIDMFLAMEINDALALTRQWLASPPWAARLERVAAPLVTSVEGRLSFLKRTGLGYLALDRSGDTLSGGEAQRIRLAAQAGSGLSGVTLVLDEPTIGLHARDNRRITDALKELSGEGNTVVVVEHDLDTIRAADMVIDLGPGGGGEGGMVVCQGSPDEIARSGGSATAAALAASPVSRIIPSPRPGPDGSAPSVVVEDVNLFHFSHQDISIPLNALVVITGVSGAGKSTLLSGVVEPSLRKHLAGEPLPAHVGGLKGAESVSRVASVDSSPIGRTPRSCPVTYSGVWSRIRELFASSRDARTRGFRAAAFSFNVKGGRCEECGGQGAVRVSLGILPDHFVKCGACMGKRYQRAILDIRWKGKNIAEILQMTVKDAADFFRAVPGIAGPLSAMDDLGIGYIRLGQPAPSLSGGEAQRLKLARELVARGKGGTVYMLDEPTTGLHARDVGLLLRHLHRLVDLGGTVIVVEHNLDVIASADWIIDLGPGGGRHGGKVVFQGSPGECARAHTATGEALRAFYGTDMR